jgi:UrcA family protein
MTRRERNSVKVSLTVSQILCLLSTGGRRILLPSRSIQSTVYHMNAETMPSRLCDFKTVVRAASLIAVCMSVSIAALAQQQSVAAPTIAAKESLAGIDFATPEGIAAARDRLHEKAREFCSQISGNLDPSHRADFLGCIDNVLTNELKQLSSSARAAIAAHGSAWPVASEDGTTSQLRESVPDTSVMAVSIADLDLMSSQGVLIAQKRIRRSARRICSQLISSQEPASYYTKCVNDATAGALRQIHLAALASN